MPGSGSVAQKKTRTQQTMSGEDKERNAMPSTEERLIHMGPHPTSCPHPTLFCLASIMGEKEEKQKSRLQTGMLLADRLPATNENLYNEPV